MQYFRVHTPSLFLCALFISAATRAADLPPIDPTNLPPRTIPQRQPLRPIPQWLQHNQRVGHLPPDLRMAQEFLKAGYDVVTINVLEKWDIVGPSANLYDPQRVKAAEEYMHTHVERCRAAGARAIFYMGPVQVANNSPAFAKAHPDWLRINADGKPDPKPNHANIRSGYAHWLAAQLAYVTREFKVDGYWFDGYAPVHLHTYDPATREAFRQFSGGKEIPTKFDPVHDPISRQYLAWHNDYFVRFADHLREVIRKENPDAVIYANHSANRTWYYPDNYMGEYPLDYSSAVDVSSVELYWDVPGDPLYQQFVYAFMQAITRQRGSTVWIQPQSHGISGVSSPIEIQLRGLECTPWGVTPEFVESTGREEYYKLHLQNIKAREEWMRNSQAISYIGIVASEQTRTLYAQAALPAYFSHTLGAFRSFQEKHLPVRILTECDLEDADLQNIRVLVLPNVAAMSDRAAEVIRRFVKNGGALIASYETSLYDENFQKRPDFALADLFCAKYLGHDIVNQRSENLHLTLDADHPILTDPAIESKQNTAWRNPGNPPQKGPLALIASAAQVESTTGGQVISTYKTEHPTNPKERHPAIITSQFGQGRVVYFPASIDKAMFFYPDGYMRQMLNNAAHWAAQNDPPLMEVQGPLILTTTFRQQPEQHRYLVHLLNQASSWGQHSTYQKLAPLPEELNKKYGFPNQSELRGTWPIREEIIPLSNIKITCRAPNIKKATLQPANTNLPLIQTNDGVQVIVNDLGMHAIVVFE